METGLVFDRRIGWMWYARLERWIGNEALVAMVSVELRIDGSGVSLYDETQPEHVYGARNVGCRKSEMEPHHVCRHA